MSFLVVWARPGLPDSTAFCLFVVSNTWLLCFVLTLIASILVGGVVGGLALVRVRVVPLVAVPKAARRVVSSLFWASEAPPLPLARPV